MFVCIFQPISVDNHELMQAEGWENEGEAVAALGKVKLLAVGLGADPCHFFVGFDADANVVKRRKIRKQADVATVDGR